MTKLGFLKTNMGLTRKVMRFGLIIPIILGMIRRFRENAIKPVKNFILATIADIGGALYFLLDHPLYFTKIGFIKSWSEER